MGWCVPSLNICVCTFLYMCTPLGCMSFDQGRDFRFHENRKRWKLMWVQAMLKSMIWMLLHSHHHQPAPQYGHNIFLRHCQILIANKNFVPESSSSSRTEVWILMHESLLCMYPYIVWPSYYSWVVHDPKIVAKLERRSKGGNQCHMD